MMGLVVIALEGVLINREPLFVDLRTDQVDPIGKEIYGSMAVRNKIVLASSQPRALVDHWCRIHSITSHDGLERLDNDVIRRVRAAGSNPELYVDADPDRCARAVHEGVAALLLARAVYARPGSHHPSAPPSNVRPWAQLVAEQDSQRESLSSTVYNDEQYERP